MNKKINSKNISKLLKNKRNENSSKYDFGHVLIIAGSIGMLGASVLTAKSAMKIGAGLVTVCVPEGLIIPAMTHFVEEMTLSVASDSKYFFDLKSFDFLIEYLQNKKISVVAIGPGLGRENETILFVQKMIKFLIEKEIPIIIDADALYAISDIKKSENFEKDIFKNSNYTEKNIIITPHEKEMQRLTNISDISFVKNNREFCCEKLAKKNGIICVLKGKNSVISDGSNIFINTTGNAGMSTAGSGDVLTGILAGLTAQYKKLEMLEIAKTGVFIHGLSGDIAKNKVGENCLIASDLIKFLPQCFEKL